MRVLWGAQGCFLLGVHLGVELLAGSWSVCILCFLLPFLKDHLEDRNIPRELQALKAIEGSYLS